MARVLVVDNDPHSLRTCAADLECDGHDVLIAATGTDALRLIAEQDLDVLVTEVPLPGIDGLDLMNRALARDRSLLVILNCRSAVHQANFMSWTADAYVLKSQDNRHLRAKIRGLIAARATARFEAGLLASVVTEDHRERRPEAAPPLPLASAVARPTKHHVH